MDSAGRSRPHPNNQAALAVILKGLNKKTHDPKKERTACLTKIQRIRGTFVTGISELWERRFRRRQDMEIMV
jgi:hypothetical protein